MRILVAENEAIVARDITGFLREGGHAVMGVVGAAAEVIDAVDADRPDLVLLDIHLKGGGDGIAIGRQLREQHHVPVVYLTAHADAATVQRAALTHPFGYVLKPLDERTLQIALVVAAQMVADEQALQGANAQLAASVAALEQRTREVAILSTLGGALLRCTEAAESSLVIAEAARALFPNASGALLIQRAHPPAVEPVAVWGTTHDDAHNLYPDQCWALRHRQIHQPNSEPEPCACDSAVRPHAGFLCVPLVTDDMALGVLQIRLAPGDEGADAPQRQLALALAEQAALGLANLRLHSALREQAIRDSLTGLYNRRYLDDLLQREQSRAARSMHPIGLIMLDIDHFKQVNDTYGHAAGDTVLRAVSRLLLAHVRAEDVVCRYGGEEFVLMLPSAPAAVALARAEMLRLAVQQMQVAYDGRWLPPITISGGVLSIIDYTMPASESLRRVDDALYAAKRAGRNQTRLAADRA